MAGRAELDLAELRTVVARAREDALRLVRDVTVARAALREPLAQARAERERLEREALAAYRNRQLGPEDRALLQRIDRGETTWRDVAHGTDDHWTAARLRERVGQDVADEVEELRTSDPDFLAEHEAALAAADDLARRAH